MTDARRDQPAILGGTPLISEPPSDWPPLDESVMEALQVCLGSGDWGRYEGGSVEQLKQMLQERTHAEHVVPCSSGTAAVELALRGLKIGEGDEVILSAYDFKANFQNVLLVGATPVLVDTSPGSWMIDIGQLPAAMSERTRAVLVSHLHGGLAPMSALRQFCEAHGVALIEDACQAPGAVVAAREAGAWGDVAVFSFGGSKLLSAGRGGAVVTPRADIAQRIQLYTQRGNLAYPLSELQAAVVLGQFRLLDERNRQRLSNVTWLLELLRAVGGVDAPAWEPDDRPTFYKLGLTYRPAAFGGLNRDVFSRALRAEGVAVDPGFRALHRTHSRRRFRAIGDLPAADHADTQTLVLHHPVLLDGERAMTAIANSVRKIRNAAAELVDRFGEGSVKE